MIFFDVSSPAVGFEPTTMAQPVCWPSRLYEIILTLSKRSILNDCEHGVRFVVKISNYELWTWLKNELNGSSLWWMAFRLSGEIDSFNIWLVTKLNRNFRFEWWQSIHSLNKPQKHRDDNQCDQIGQSFLTCW